jgi:hypothetical protein
VIRRRMTVKRLDPWSVLKFGAVANVVLFAILMLLAGVIWFIVDRLQLVDQVCGIATDVGFTSCGVNAGNLFSALGLLGGMGVIIQTAVLVFFAFLYTLISDLTGGLTIGVVEEGTPVRSAPASKRNLTASSVPPRTTNATGSSAPSQVVPQAAQDAPSPRSREPAGRSRPEGDELFNES